MDILKVILTASLSVAALFIITKVMGHKQVAQLDFFDYISGITIGSIAAELATELETPMQPLIALVVYGVFSVAITMISRKLPRTRKYINGQPTVIFDRGTIYRDRLKKAKLDLSELMLLFREQGYFDLDDVECAVFEHNGRLSVLPKSSRRPIIPDDMGIRVKSSYISTELIMDGEILADNLKEIGKDRRWLEKRLAECTDERIQKICLAVYFADSDRLSVYTDGHG